MQMKNTSKRSKSYGRRRSSRTLLLGLLAGSVLAGVGSYEALAEELTQPTTDANGTTLDLGGKDAETAKANAQKIISDIQKGKEDKHKLLTKTGGVFTLSEEFSKRVEGSIGFEEVEESDTETVKRLKTEQKSISTLIKTKYDEAKSLGGVVQGVRGENLGSGTLTKQVAVSEGEERLAVLTGELEALVAVKGILDTDVGDAKNIENEIKQIEEQIRKQLEATLGGEIEGSFGLSEDGTLNVTGDYIEYLNVLESEQGSLNVRSSFVQQSTKDSKVLASYFGQNSDLDALIGEGFKYLDMPYVWGGESVSEGGFDCSGLMQRIFKDTLGLDIPRVSQDQQNFGKQIPLDELQPGDLVFWNTPATHVALYLGDGKIMEAANTQAGLRVRDVRLSELSSATRVHDFGVSDKDAVVHITNAKRTVSYTPVLNREQSVEYNNTVSKAETGVSKAEINAQVKAIEQKARDEQAKVAKQEKAKADKATSDKQKAEQDKVAKETSAKQKAEQDKVAKEKADKDNQDKDKQEQDKAKQEQDKAKQAKVEEERVAKEKAEQEKLQADKAKAEQERLDKEKAELEKENQDKEAVDEAIKDKTPSPEEVKPTRDPVTDSKAPDKPVQEEVVQPQVEKEAVAVPQEQEDVSVTSGSESTEVVQE